jgi:hypothetical protein
VADEMLRVGRVLGTEDSTPLEFWVGIEEETYLQLDDVVVVQTDVPGAGPLRVSGIVDRVNIGEQTKDVRQTSIVRRDGPVLAQNHVSDDRKNRHRAPRSPLLAGGMEMIARRRRVCKHNEGPTLRLSAFCQALAVGNW